MSLQTSTGLQGGAPGKTASEAELFPQKSSRRSDELRPPGAYHGAVTRVGDNPEARVGNGFCHFDRNLNRIKGIAITLYDERPRLNRGEVRLREVHVVITVGECL